MRTPTRPITIAGGGLAGLSLGVALRRRGVPVSLHEASAYPRHRVCGEFLNGVTADTLAALGVDDVFDDALRHRATRWFHDGREVFRGQLPRPALAVSRYRVDDRLQRLFTESGGRLHARSRLAPEAREGMVWAAGRLARKGGRWVGLKCHLSGLALSGDLEMHLGRGAYVGATPVEGGRVNLCGLFPKDALPSGLRRVEMLLGALRSVGLGELALKVGDARAHDDSFVGAAGFELGTQRHVPELLALGDSEAIIPPFTGNGMSMAFEAAESAVGPLAAYSSGDLGWGEARQRVAGALRRRFRSRLVAARLIHPFFLRPLAQGALAAVARARLLPFRTACGMLT